MVDMVKGIPRFGPKNRSRQVRIFSVRKLSDLPDVLHLRPYMKPENIARNVGTAVYELPRLGIADGKVVVAELFCRANALNDERRFQEAIFVDISKFRHEDNSWLDRRRAVIGRIARREQVLEWLPQDEIFRNALGAGALRSIYRLKPRLDGKTGMAGRFHLVGADMLEKNWAKFEKLGFLWDDIIPIFKDGFSARAEVSDRELKDREFYKNDLLRDKLWGELAAYIEKRYGLFVAT